MVESGWYGWKGEWRGGGVEVGKRNTIAIGKGKIILKKGCLHIDICIENDYMNKSLSHI